MRRSYKFRLYPNKLQREALDRIFSFNTFLYNNALEQRISYYKRFKKSLSYNSQAGELLEIKEMFAEQTNIIYSQILQQTLKRLDAAYKNFFRRIKNKEKSVGFPRFRSEMKSICFPQSDLASGGVKRLPNNKIKIFGVDGEVSAVWHREIQGIVKTVSIKKSANKYYIIASCDHVPKEHREKTGKTIAIDFGLNSFITTDDGTKFHHPKPYKTAKEKLAYLQRKLAAKQRGSNNRRKAKLSLQKASEKVSNIRNDFQHKLSKQIIKQNDKIIIEKLNIQGMLQNKKDGKKFVKNLNISDASWGNFVSHLKHKAESAGVEIIEVDPKNTSKTCSKCGNIKEILKLSDRLYDCEACGFAKDRDINAAINIKNFGLGTSPAMAKSHFRSLRL